MNNFIYLFILQIPAAQASEEPAPAEIQLTTRPPQARLTREESYAEKLSQVPQLSHIIHDSPLFKSSPIFELTESETEYNVKCIKHSFADYLVLQFDCVNTLSDQLLENVSVAVEPPEGYELICEIQCCKLAYNEPGTTYTVLQYPDDVNSSVTTIPTTLRFIAKDCDPNTGLPEAEQGYQDEYMLEDLDITLADQMRGSKTRGIDINAAWETAGSRGFTCVENTFALGANVTSLEAAVQSLVGFLGLEPANRSDRVQAGATSHVLLLHGSFRGNKEIFARARLALVNSQVTMELSVRSQDADVASLVLESVG